MYYSGVGKSEGAEMTDTKSAYEKFQEAMASQTKAMSTLQLCDALLLLEGRELDKAERMVQAHISDEICKRIPEANAAADRWAEDEQMWDLELTEVIVAAALDIVRA
jgi:hypothetical protein